MDLLPAPLAWLVDEAGAIRAVAITPQCGLQLVDVGCACGAGPGAVNCELKISF